MRLIEKSNVSTLDYSKNKEVQLDMPVDNLYRRWVLDFTIGLSCGSTTLSSDAKNNDFLNLIKKIIVYHNGSKTRSNLSAVDRYYLDLFEHGCVSVKDGLSIPALDGSSTQKVTLVIDFARNRKKLSDFSALLDAPASKSVKLGIEWGDITDIFNTEGDGSIDADTTTCRVSVLEAYDDEGANGSALAEVRKNLVFIKQDASETKIDKEYASYDSDMLEIKVKPVNATVLSHLFLAKENVTDLDPAFSADVIEQFKVQNVEGAGEILISNYWDNLVNPLKQDYSLQSLPDGMLFVDWLDQRQRGLVVTKADAMKIRLLTSEPATTDTNNSLRVITTYVTADT